MLQKCHRIISNVSKGKVSHKCRKIVAQLSQMSQMLQFNSELRHFCNTATMSRKSVQRLFGEQFSAKWEFLFLNNLDSVHYRKFQRWVPCDIFGIEKFDPSVCFKYDTSTSLVTSTYDVRSSYLVAKPQIEYSCNQRTWIDMRQLLCYLDVDLDGCSVVHTHITPGGTTLLRFTAPSSR